MIPGWYEHIPGHSATFFTMSSRPPRKILKATTSKIKKASASKRQRAGDDSDDEDYAPAPSDMAAASSVGGIGDDSSDEDVEGGRMMSLTLWG